jgi:hypothetical protein
VTLLSEVSVTSPKAIKSPKRLPTWESRPLKQCGRNVTELLQDNQEFAVHPARGEGLATPVSERRYSAIDAVLRSIQTNEDSASVPAAEFLAPSVFMNDSIELKRRLAF